MVELDRRVIGIISVVLGGLLLYFHNQVYFSIVYSYYGGFEDFLDYLDYYGVFILIILIIIGGILSVWRIQKGAFVAIMSAAILLTIIIIKMFIALDFIVGETSSIKWGPFLVHGFHYIINKTLFATVVIIVNRPGLRGTRGVEPVEPADDL